MRSAHALRAPRSRRPSSTSATTSSGASGNRERCLSATTRNASAGFQRAVDKLMAVAVLAMDGEEHIALGQRAAVDGNAGYRRPADLPAGPACIAAAIASMVQSPLMRPSPARPPQPPHDRENGRTRSPMICPVSWPLPAISSTSPALQLGNRPPDRFGAIADLDGARRIGENGGANRRRILAARIVVGDDDPVGALRGDRAP